MPEKVELLVLDFDGVLTDNRVWVDQDGREMVAANRSDSLGHEYAARERCGGLCHLKGDQPGGGGPLPKDEYPLYPG